MRLCASRRDVLDISRGRHKQPPGRGAAAAMPAPTTEEVADTLLDVITPSMLDEMRTRQSIVNQQDCHNLSCSGHASARRSLGVQQSMLRAFRSWFAEHVRRQFPVVTEVMT